MPVPLAVFKNIYIIFNIHFLFSQRQVLVNVNLALVAMGIGAVGLPLDLSNLLGGLMVLLMAAFGRFLLNDDRIPVGERGR